MILWLVIIGIVAGLFFVWAFIHPVRFLIFLAKLITVLAGLIGLLAVITNAAATFSDPTFAGIFWIIVGVAFTVGCFVARNRLSYA